MQIISCKDSGSEFIVTIKASWKSFEFNQRQRNSNGMFKKYNTPDYEKLMNCEVWCYLKT